MYYLATVLLLFLPVIGLSQSYQETTTYLYDDLNRLIQVDYPDGSVYNYVYDNLGNRIQIAYTYNPPLELDEQLLKNTITVYPNPTTGNISIEIPEEFHSEIIEVHVVDMHGKTVIEKQQHQKQGTIQLETTEMKPGVYLLNISSKEQSWDQLFIKQ